ncbi:MAG: hypothetical protein UT66_C0009G0007 [candidate division CPR2 bacterium GW2011_GWC1_39_9]|uniref:Uncharacterized protein n=1 Tax=candidate division CPR2 bacterium GW2011_GWC2_39_10 TaxID=1618345 RepID=A0A0G0M3X6_UNCC2|nr:MAG: hypothetical protein UT18_C0004G0012 [candidate division CPR2 bacterium GW2011_GWC2_39_10]KKR35644.1 MAG: hypothetical protein UT66_C0009G0007 [candidate division CPR2 bacterium GW2011_GWC1_39_9]
MSSNERYVKVKVTQGGKIRTAYYNIGTKKCNWDPYMVPENHVFLKEEPEIMLAKGQALTAEMIEEALCSLD